MNAPTKAVNLLQAYRIVLYRRALHPELFKVRNRLFVSHGDYEFEGWVMPGAHLMRFQLGAVSVTELLTDQESGLPERGVAAGFPCAGERDHEQLFGDRVNYVSTVQTETLNENLYASTYKELIDFAREEDAVAHLWEDAHGAKSASILDIQRYKKEVHAQSYHLLSPGGLVIRSQTIFEVR